MFNLLIVEDDEEICRALAKSPAWAKRGFRICGAARSAEEALAAAQACRPDAVLTDIRMEDVSGLDLIQQMRRLYPDMLFIILSGYSEFEYARRAVSLEVFEYLTKPVDEARLDSVFEALRKRLMQRRIVQSSISTARREFARALLTHQVARNYLQERFAALQLGNPDGRYQVVLLEGELPPDEVLSAAFQDKAWLCLPFEAGYAVILAGGKGAQEAEFKRCLQADGVRFGLSDSKSGADRLFERRREAEEALDRLYFSEEGADWLLCREAMRRQPPSGKLREEIGHIAAQWDSMDWRRLDMALRGFLQRLRAEAVSAADARRLLADLAEAVCGRAGCALGQMPGVSGFETLDQAGDAMRKTCRALMEESRKNLAGARESISGRAREYIEKHLEERLSLADIAGALYVNPSYLSRAFKKETQKNISAYINEQKIRRAQAYMRDLDIGIREISIRLGFSDYAYFCVLFKKQTGETPLAYRKRVLFGEGSGG